MILICSGGHLCNPLARIQTLHSLYRNVYSNSSDDIDSTLFIFFFGQHYLESILWLSVNNVKPFSANTTCIRIRLTISFVVLMPDGVLNRTNKQKNDVLYRNDVVAVSSPITHHLYYNFNAHIIANRNCISWLSWQPFESSHCTHDTMIYCAPKMNRCS